MKYEESCILRVVHAVIDRKRRYRRLQWRCAGQGGICRSQSVPRQLLACGCTCCGRIHQSSTWQFSFSSPLFAPKLHHTAKSSKNKAGRKSCFTL